jgi:8-oxo-dGTP pyrophosphatase MutT (NUDIX family)
MPRLLLIENPPIPPLVKGGEEAFEQPPRGDLWLQRHGIQLNGEPSVPDESLDVIDEKDRITGQAPKALVHLQGLRHRVAAVLLQRKDGRYLIPTASGIKAEAGLLYHSAAGHVLSGESYENSARRELQEETGLTAEELNYLGAFWFEKDYPSRLEKEYFHVYRASYRRSMGPVRLNEEQVNEQWITEAELEALYRDKPESISAPLLMTCEHILGFENRSSPASSNRPREI